jgi:hypothetical protein
MQPPGSHARPVHYQRCEGFALDILRDLASLFSAGFALSGLNTVQRIQLQHRPIMSFHNIYMLYVEQVSGLYCS